MKLVTSVTRKKCHSHVIEVCNIIYSKLRGRFPNLAECVADFYTSVFLMKIEDESMSQIGTMIVSDYAVTREYTL